MGIIWDEIYLCHNIKLNFESCKWTSRKCKNNACIDGSNTLVALQLFVQYDQLLLLSMVAPFVLHISETVARLWNSSSVVRCIVLW